MYGYSVRYDSGLQGFNLVAASRDLGGTLEAAEVYCRNWGSARADKALCMAT